MVVLGRMRQVVLPCRKRIIRIPEPKMTLIGKMMKIVLPNRIMESVLPITHGASCHDNRDSPLRQDEVRNALRLGVRERNPKQDDRYCAPEQDDGSCTIQGNGDGVPMKDDGDQAYRQDD